MEQLALFEMFGIYVIDLQDRCIQTFEILTYFWNFIFEYISCLL